MVARSILKTQRISPLKVRLVANYIRGMHVEKAVDFLEHSNKKAASIILGCLSSAIANAENNHNMDIDELRVSKICVDQGPTLKRMMPRAKGRGDRILKRSCHITVEVSE